MPTDRIDHVNKRLHFRLGASTGPGLSLAMPLTRNTHSLLLVCWAVRAWAQPCSQSYSENSCSMQTISSGSCTSTRRTCSGSACGSVFTTEVRTETCAHASSSGTTCSHSVTQDGVTNVTNCFCVNSASVSLSAPCVCNVGFTGPTGGPCAACAKGKYKSSSGSELCIPCASGKYSTPGATACRDCRDSIGSCDRFVVSWHQSSAVLARVYQSEQQAWEKFEEMKALTW